MFQCCQMCVVPAIIARGGSGAATNGVGKGCSLPPGSTSTSAPGTAGESAVGAGALAAAANWAANLLVGSTFPALLAGAGVTGAYGLYAVLNVGCFLFVRRRVVETARRPLAEARAAVANS